VARTVSPSRRPDKASRPRPGPPGGASEPPARAGPAEARAARRAQAHEAAEAFLATFAFPARAEAP
jgi:hypothetical protein